MVAVEGALPGGGCRGGGALRLLRPAHRLSRGPCGIAPGPRRQVGVLWGGPGGVYGAAGCPAELGRGGGVMARGL